MVVERGFADESSIEQVLARSESAGIHPMRGLAESGLVSRANLLSVIADQIGVGFADVTSCTPSPDALLRIDRPTAIAHQALPVDISDGVVGVAIADPLDGTKVKVLEKISGVRMRPLLADRSALGAAIEHAYASAPQVAPPAPLSEPQPAEDLSPVAPVVAPEEATGRTEAPDITVGEGNRTGYHLNELLVKLVEAKGSDLHLTAGTPPQMRVNGELHPVEGYGKLMPAQLLELIYAILTGRQKEELENALELDCSHPIAGYGRFRVNVFFQRGSIGAVMRAIPEGILSVEELGLPPVVREFANLSRGLVLVTGPTGSGKSTTLAAIIDLINRTRPVHVITIEDPIEFLHRHNRAIVNQREVGGDTHGFSAALRHALRQDPDVILVGELRDLETMATALTAAETGHLVFATLHTQTAPQSIERMIDVFPSHQQTQVRVQLASTIQGVLSQQLLRTVDGNGRVAAIEVMVATPAIRNLVREGKVHQIISALQSGAKYGMQTLDQSLAALVRSGQVEMSEALERAVDQDQFATLTGGRR